MKKQILLLLTILTMTLSFGQNKKVGKLRITKTPDAVATDTLIAIKDNGLVVKTDIAVGDVGSGSGTGFEAFQGGWRLVGSTLADRLTIGSATLDGTIVDVPTIGQVDTPASPFGSSAVGSILFGQNNKDTGDFNNTVIGSVNETDAFALDVLLGGYNKSGFGYGNFLGGTYNTITPGNVNSFLFAIGHNNTVTSRFGGGALGIALDVRGDGEVVVGKANIPWTGADNGSNRPMFTVGTGTTTTPAGRWQPLVQKNSFQILNDGTGYFNEYGSGTFTGTPTFDLQVDATGKVVEVPITGGGSNDNIYTIDGSTPASTIRTLTVGSAGELNIDGGGQSLLEVYEDNFVVSSVTARMQDYTGSAFRIINGLSDIRGSQGVRMAIGSGGTFTNPNAGDILVATNALGDLAWSTPTTSASTGLEKITEGSSGWRLIGVNPAQYGNIGNNAVDLSIQSSTSSIRGATGFEAFASGKNTRSSGFYSHAEGELTWASGNAAHAEGRQSVASGNYSHAENSGNASGDYSHAGGSNSTASGESSFSHGNGTVSAGRGGVSMGYNMEAPSFSEVAVGLYGTQYSPGNALVPVATDRAFSVGNGTNSANRSDALVVLKNGNISAPSYGSGTVTGTPTFDLQVDANGNVVEAPISGGGGGVTQTTGTFVPTVIDAGGGATYTVGSVQHARYIKTGNQVYFTIYLINVGMTGTPSGALRIGNLPFNCLYDAEMASVGISGGNVPFYSLRGVIDNTNGTEIQFLFKNALNTSAGSFMNAVTFSGSGQIRVSGTYYAN